MSSGKLQTINHYFSNADTIYNVSNLPANAQFVDAQGNPINNIITITDATHYASHITDHSSPITDHSSPITDHSSPITDYSSLYSGKWYFVTSAIDADIKVYVDNNGFDADLWIYEDAPSYHNIHKCGFIRTVNSLIDADLKVFRTNSPIDADLRIFYTSDKHKAGIK